MAWVYLVFAGFFEVAFTTCLKLSDNFTNRWWSAGFFISITLSFFLLNKAVQTIPLGTGYAVWTGIGAVGTALVGIFYFSRARLFLEGVFYHPPHRLNNRFESCVSLKGLYQVFFHLIPQPMAFVFGVATVCPASKASTASSTYFLLALPAFLLLLSIVPI